MNFKLLFMKKTTLHFLIICLIFCSCDRIEKKNNEDNIQRKSWLQLWGYNRKMKTLTHKAYYAYSKKGDIKKNGLIDSSFFAIDQTFYPYRRTEFNLFGDIDKVVWYESKFKKNLKKRIYKYNNNKLEYINFKDNNSNFKLNVINNKDGYVHKILFKKKVVQIYERNDNDYITDIKWVEDNNYQQYKYNKNGQVIESKSFFKDLEIYEITKSYYKNNRITRAVTNNYSDQLIFKYEFSEFDENNNFTEIIIYDANSKPLYIVEFERTYYN